jgi:hypothetical protein
MLSKTNLPNHTKYEHHSLIRPGWRLAHVVQTVFQWLHILRALQYCACKCRAWLKLLFEHRCYPRSIDSIHKSAACRLLCSHLLAYL